MSDSPVIDLLACPTCRGCTVRLEHSPPLPSDKIYCGRCARVLRRVRPPDAPAPRYRQAPAGAMPHEQEAPPAGWHWLGLTKLDDGNWYPVALAETLPRCWEALLHYP